MVAVSGAAGLNRLPVEEPLRKEEEERVFEFEEPDEEEEPIIAGAWWWCTGSSRLAHSLPMSDIISGFCLWAEL